MRTVCVFTISSLFSFGSIAQANPGSQILKLYPGHGITLSFRAIGETVHKTWLDDPSQVTLDFDDPNCLSAAEKRTCAAQVLHLRRINRLSFPGLPQTPTTALTIVTNRNIHRFELTFPNSGMPTTDIINVALPSNKLPRKQESRRN